MHVLRDRPHQQVTLWDTGLHGDIVRFLNWLGTRLGLNHPKE